MLIGKRQPNIRTPPITNQIRQLRAFQGRILTLIHHDELYLQKYGRFGETPVLLSHGSRVRLLDTHSHTSKRPGYEASKAWRVTTGGNADLQ